MCTQIIQARCLLSHARATLIYTRPKPNRFSYSRLCSLTTWEDLARYYLTNHALARIKQTAP